MTKLIDLTKWGLTDSFKNEFDAKYKQMYLGRVIFESQKIYKIITTGGEILAEVTGKYSFEALDKSDFPAVGDWVVLDRNETGSGHAIIHNLLTRKSKISRKVAGNRIDEQIIASNIDFIFICISLNKDFNIRRLERYLSIVWSSQAVPVVVLTKSDLCEDIDDKMIQVENAAVGIDIHITSAINHHGTDIIGDYLTQGKTGAFIGSSGVGKSTLINSIIGEDLMHTSGLRNDDKGRHTTTHRELIAIPSGGAVIDTPGMREIQILDIDESVDHAFRDIEDLISHCKFSDCQHNSEPGCAINAALKDSSLEESRYNNYLHMKKEIAFLNSKGDKKAMSERKSQWVQISKSHKQTVRHNRKRNNY